MADLDEVKPYVAHAVTSIKDCADVGMYTFAKMSPHMAGFVGIALFVKNGIVSSAPDPYAPIMTELKELKKDIKTTEEKMKARFDDLKAFIVAQYFYNNIAVKASALCQFWSDLLLMKNQRDQKEAVEFFEKLYVKYGPLQLAATLMQLIKNEVTNLLKQSMAADTLMTVDTFEKNRNLIGGVLSQLWMIECYASALFHNGDQYRARKIAKLCTKFEEISKKWQDEYTGGDGFWPDKIRQFVEKIQDENEEKTSAEKADMIKAGLEKIMTKDLFYIVVCRTAFRCLLFNNPADQTIASWDRKACNVFIFRSKHGRSASADEMKKFREDLDKNKRILRHRFEQNNRNAEWMLQSQVEQRAANIPNCAFMVVVRSGEYVAVRSTHTEIRENGPGGWIDGNYHPGNEWSAGEPFKMVAGFR